MHSILVIREFQVLVPYSCGNPFNRYFPPDVVAVCTQSCLTLCDPMDCSPPGSSVHGISQARILEWVAMSSSRGSSHPRKIFPPEPRSPALQMDSLSSEPLGKPEYRLSTHTHTHTHTHARTLQVAKTGCKDTAVFSLQAESLGLVLVTG